MIRRLMATREAVLFVIIVLMCIGFALFVDGFLDWTSLMRRSRYWAATGMIAVPMTFIIATAGIDLSVASILALSGVILGMTYTDLGWPIGAAMAAAAFMGAAAGAFNGGVSSYMGVPPLVATLGSMVLFRGVAMGLSRARSFGGYPDGFLWLANGNLLEWAPGGLYLPAPLLPTAAIFVVGGLLMRKSWIGRFTECIGENETAARFAAIDVRFMKFMLYTASGFVCGLAATMNTAVYATAKADTAAGMELEAIACVVIGGNRISGGQGSVIGSLFGLLIIGILRHGLLQARVKAQYIVIIVGVLLVVTAVINERIAARRESK